MERRLVYYTGEHLGVAPRTILPGGLLHVTWDRPVKSLPADAAADLLRSRSFLEALPPSFAAKRYGLDVEDLEGLELHTEDFVRKGSEPAEVIVLDKATVTALRRARDGKELEWPLSTAPADYLKRHPDGPKADLARKILEASASEDQKAPTDESKEE